MTEENEQPQQTTLDVNVMSLAHLIKKMKDMGIPYPTGLDILRIALMFATAGPDVDKAAAAVMPQDMKEQVN